MVSKFKPAAPSLGCPNPEAAPASPQLTARQRLATPTQEIPAKTRWFIAADGLPGGLTDGRSLC